jgi:hypothetical protein
MRETEIDDNDRARLKKKYGDKERRGTCCREERPRAETPRRDGRSSRGGDRKTKRNEILQAGGGLIGVANQPGHAMPAAEGRGRFTAR